MKQKIEKNEMVWFHKTFRDCPKKFWWSCDKNCSLCFIFPHLCSPLRKFLNKLHRCSLKTDLGIDKTNTLQAWDLPTCTGFFGLIFPTKRFFEPTILLLKKAARCQLFLAVVRCLFHNHLRLKCSSLLNVYLNCKFEISLLTSHLFFSLFSLMVCSLPRFPCTPVCSRCASLFPKVKVLVITCYREF